MLDDEARFDYTLVDFLQQEIACKIGQPSPTGISGDEPIPGYEIGGISYLLIRDNQTLDDAINILRELREDFDSQKGSLISQLQSVQENIQSGEFKSLSKQLHSATTFKQLDDFSIIFNISLRKQVLKTLGIEETTPDILYSQPIEFDDHTVELHELNVSQLIGFLHKQYQQGLEESDAQIVKSGSNSDADVKIKGRSFRALGKEPTAEQFTVIWQAHLTQAPNETGNIGKPDSDGIYRKSTLLPETKGMKYAVLMESKLFSKEQIKRLFDYGACGNEDDAASLGAAPLEEVRLDLRHYISGINLVLQKEGGLLEYDPQDLNELKEGLEEALQAVEGGTPFAALDPLINIYGSILNLMVFDYRLTEMLSDFMKDCSRENYQKMLLSWVQGIRKKDPAAASAMLLEIEIQYLTNIGTALFMSPDMDSWRGLWDEIEQFKRPLLDARVKLSEALKSGSRKKINKARWDVYRQIDGWIDRMDRLAPQISAWRPNVVFWWEGGKPHPAERTMSDDGPYNAFKEKMLLLKEVLRGNNESEKPKPSVEATATNIGTQKSPSPMIILNSKKISVEEARRELNKISSQSKFIFNARMKDGVLEIGTGITHEAILHPAWGSAWTFSGSRYPDLIEIVPFISVGEMDDEDQRIYRDNLICIAQNLIQCGFAASIGLSRATPFFSEPFPKTLGELAGQILSSGQTVDANINGFIPQGDTLQPSPDVTASQAPDVSTKYEGESKIVPKEVLKTEIRELQAIFYVQVLEGDNLEVIETSLRSHALYSTGVRKALEKYLRTKRLTDNFVPIIRGSFALGIAHPHSDLEMYLLPAENRSRPIDEEKVLHDTLAKAGIAWDDVQGEGTFEVFFHNVDWYHPDYWTALKNQILLHSRPLLVRTDNAALMLALQQRFDHQRQILGDKDILAVYVTDCIKTLKGSLVSTDSNDLNHERDEYLDSRTNYPLKALATAKMLFDALAFLAVMKEGPDAVMSTAPVGDDEQPFIDMLNKVRGLKIKDDEITGDDIRQYIALRALFIRMCNKDFYRSMPFDKTFISRLNFLNNFVTKVTNMMDNELKGEKRGEVQKPTTLSGPAIKGSKAPQDRRFSQATDSRPIILKVFQEIAKIGNLTEIQSMDPFKFAELIGAKEVRSEEINFFLLIVCTAITPEHWQSIVKKRESGNLGTWSESILENTKEIKGPGIYYSKGGMENQAAIWHEEVAKSSFAHELFEMTSGQLGLVDKYWVHTLHHHHFVVLEGELRFASLMGVDELATRQKAIREQLRLLKDTEENRSIRQQTEKLLEESKTNKFRESSLALWVEAEANRIHAENLKYTPSLAENTVLCHIAAPATLPAGQQGILNRLDSGMRGREYREKMLELQTKSSIDFIEQVKDTIQKAQETYKKVYGKDYANYTFKFDVACPNLDLVARVQNELNLPALAFAPQEGEGNVVQPENIMLALRALEQAIEEKNIKPLIDVYAFVTGKEITSSVKDIAEFAKTMLFAMPKINVNELGRINALIEENIKTAA
jgi:hypothetical protein